MKKLQGCAYLAFDDHKKQLKDELKRRFSYTSEPIEYENLLYYQGENTVEPSWAKTSLSEVYELSFESISQASSALKTIMRNWAPYSYQHFRRIALIQEKLPYINTKVKPFPFNVPHSDIGLFTLTDKNTALIFPKSTSLFPAGNITLIEDHENPPSRAYLKFQEALVRFNHRYGYLPKKGERCFDAGACPGGWTWVLTELGCNVFAVDRSELDPRLMKNPLVEFKTHDAFTLPPNDVGAFDWVFSDVICYPDRLLEWVKKWIDSGLTKNMICSIKMQGETNWNLIDEFAKIPNTYIQHMQYNKHELTWMWHKE